MKKRVCASHCHVSIHEHRASASDSFLDWKGAGASIKQCVQYWQRQNCTFVWKNEHVAFLQCCMMRALFFLGAASKHIWNCAFHLCTKKITFLYALLLICYWILIGMCQWKFTERQGEKHALYLSFSHSSHMKMLWSYKNGLQCVCIKLLDVWATVHMGFWSSSLLLQA